jgi:hypothetical protein
VAASFSPAFFPKFAVFDLEAMTIIAQDTQQQLGEFYRY